MMSLRQARKIADRIFRLKPSLCPYTDWQLFYAFTRLHKAWRDTRVVTKDERGVIHGITEDYYRSQRVWTILILHKYFRYGRYRANAPKNETMNNWVRRTWSPPQS